MKVRIHLCGLIRMERTVDVEVPDDIQKSELNKLVEKTYKDSDIDQYVYDVDYWKRGDCYWEEIE